MSSATRFGKSIGTGLASLLMMAQCLMAQTGNQTGEANRAVLPSENVVVQLRPYVPMTQKQRVGNYLRGLATPEAILRSAAGAGINQATNTPSEWRQGGEGYGRRFASVYGGHLVQTTVMYGMSAALHEDNRYFLSGQSGAGARFKYAVSSAFLARHDDGTRHLSISHITSYFAVAGISRLWQPPSTAKATSAATGLGVAVAVAVGFNVAREFLPQILRGTQQPVATSQNLHAQQPVATSQNPAH